MRGSVPPGKIFSKMKNYKNTRRPDRITPSPVRKRPPETASAEDDGENGAVAGRNAVMELVSANADIEKIFVDGILKIGGRDFDSLGAMLDKLAALTGDATTVVFTVSAAEKDMPESVKKYIG